MDMILILARERAREKGKNDGMIDYLIDRYSSG